MDAEPRFYFLNRQGLEIHLDVFSRKLVANSKKILLLIDDSNRLICNLVTLLDAQSRLIFSIINMPSNRVKWIVF